MTGDFVVRAAATALVIVVATAACTSPGDSVSPSSSPPAPMSPSPSPSNSAVETTVKPTQATPQAELDQLLRDAAWRDDVAGARSLVAQGADVNAKDDTTQSAYLISTSEGYLDLLRLTLANGAEINDKDSWNGTGLIRAAERGHWLIVGELLQAGIDRDHVNRIGYQALHEAVWLGENSAAYAATVSVLVAGGVELSRPSATQQLTPLQMARERGSDLLVPVLEKATAGEEIGDPDTELLAAAQEGDADRVALALRAGGNIEAVDAKDRTPLLLAVTHDRLEAARVLVALGADPDALDDRHDTPWLVTGVTGSVAMLEVLLPARPDLTIPNRFGGLSVIPASERGHVDYVERVVTTGIDVNHINNLGWTALLEAVILGDGGQQHQDIVRILLGAGADVSIADEEGVTALQHARFRGFTEIATLLEAG